MDKSVKKVTASELIEHLKKFDKDAIVQIMLEDVVVYAEVDTDAPFADGYKHEVCIFIGDVI